MNKTIAIVLLLAATLTLVGQISISIAQHQAEAFGFYLPYIPPQTSKPPSDGGCVSGSSSSLSGCNNFSIQNQDDSGNIAAAQQ